MELKNNTVLITGGSSGIGLELASQFNRLGNKVIITSHDKDSLDAAAKKIPNLTAFQCDAADPEAIAQLHKTVVKEFPDLNILVNNAGIMRRINFHQFERELEDLTREVTINLNGVVWMVVKFLPHLKVQKKAAIVNVTSALAFTPLPSAPIYCAAKAGLHSFSRSLRVQLGQTNVRVIELAPSFVKTPLQNAVAEESKGLPVMDVAVLARKAIRGIEKGKTEITPGLASFVEVFSRLLPGFMMKQLSKTINVSFTPPSP